MELLPIQMYDGTISYQRSHC